MVLLLSVVSFLLVVGGGAAALYGADTIRTETGSTLAVAGVAMACAGLLMAALVACLSELRKIRRGLEEGEARRAIPQASFPVAVEPALVPVTAAAVAAAVVAADRAPAGAVRVPEVAPEPVEQPEVVPPQAANDEVAAPALRPTIVPDVDDEKIETVAWDPERPAHVPAEPDKQTGAETDAGPVDATPPGKPAEAAGTAGDTAVAAVPEARAREASTQEAPAREAHAHDAPAQDAPVQDAPAREPSVMEGPMTRELVATYTSGEHTYFMYSDNAIEADTPQGRFRFASMDELRVFVETGTGGMPLSPPPPRKPD